MKQILCFGDSNTWGYDGESRKRLPWGKRWTSLLQEKFDVETAKQGIQAGNNTADQREAGNAEHKSGESVRIIEEGLCGRTTIFEDPLRDGRRGTALLPTLLETHDGVDVIVLMLGTNDCKTVFGASAEVIAKASPAFWIRSQPTLRKRRYFSFPPSIWEKKYGRKDMTRNFPGIPCWYPGTWKKYTSALLMKNT